MPYQEITVAPELFLSHNGVNVYRTYSGDDIDQGAKQYWFTTKPMPLETESQFIARMIDELYARCSRSSQANEMRVKTWRGLRPITEFDEVEVHAMCECEEEGGLCQASDCPDESPSAYTVFLHCVEGGVETVQDFRFDPSEPGAKEDAEKEAEMLGKQLYDMLRAAGTLLAR